MSPDILERLRNQLRRDPSDADVALLLTIGVRDPFVIYPAERVRLRRFARLPGRSSREVLLVQASADLLQFGATPSAGLRRPEPGPTDVIDPTRVRSGPPAEAELLALKDPRQSPGSGPEQT